MNNSFPNRVVNLLNILIIKGTDLNTFFKYNTGFFNEILGFLSTVRCGVENFFLQNCASVPNSYMETLKPYYRE